MPRRSLGRVPAAQQEGGASGDLVRAGEVAARVDSDLLELD